MAKKLLLSVLACLCFCGAKSDALPELKTVFIATWTNDPEGIYSCLYDPETGELSDVRKEYTAVQSSFMALSKDKKHVYTYRREKDGRASLLSFRIGRDKRSLQLVDSLYTGMVDPCHVKVINGGKTLAAACYEDGKVIYCDISKNGRFTGPLKITDQNSTANKEPGQKSRAHMVNTDNGEKYVYVPDLGLDRVFVYKIENGLLAEKTQIPAVKGAGPRHMAFDPQGRHMALLCELNSTVMIFAPDSNGIFSRHIQTVSTVPEGYSGRKSSAHIEYSPDGKTLYASERGNSTIVCYDVDLSTGRISAAGTISDGVKTPRNYTADKNGKWLLVGNQDAGNVSVYRAAPNAKVVSKIDVAKPSCILILD